MLSVSQLLTLIRANRSDETITADKPLFPDAPFCSSHVGSTGRIGKTVALAQTACTTGRQFVKQGRAL